MYCNSCGSVVPDNAAHCPNCGAAQGSSSANVSYNTPSVSPKSVLTMGILALAFCCTFYFSFLSIIFGAIGGKKAKAYFAQGGQPSTQVKLGKIFSTIGLILGIILVVIVVIVLIAAVAAASM